MFIVQPSSCNPNNPESLHSASTFEQVVGGRGLVSCESDMDVEGTSQQKPIHRHYVDSVIRVVDVAYPIMQVQDLDEQEKFLLAFACGLALRAMLHCICVAQV